MTIEPIRRGSGAARALRAPEPDIPDSELTPRVRAIIAALHGEVDLLRKDLKQAQDRLALAEREADQDQLLPILNRRAFVRELARNIGLATRYGTPASLLYFDLDGFKSVNDVFGHAAGDAVLSRFAEVLCSQVRDSDVVGRLGGDEFGVILAHAGSELARKKALVLREAISQRPAVWKGRPLPIDYSFGALELMAGENAETAIMRADEAMYANKRATR